MSCAAFETRGEVQDFPSGSGELTRPRGVAEHVGNSPVVLGAGRHLAHQHHRDGADQRPHRGGSHQREPWLTVDLSQRKLVVV
jgi:hypothetical protein